MPDGVATAAPGAAAGLPPTGRDVRTRFAESPGLAAALPVTKPIPSYLRLHTEDPAGGWGPSLDGCASLATLCQAFEHATGWPLRYGAGPAIPQSSDLLWSAPVNPGDGTAPGHFRIELGESFDSTLEPAHRIDLEIAGELAGAVCLLASDLLRAQHALWRREGELAATVPVQPHTDETGELARRLEAVLASGVQATGCQAAGLYLLDANTTELKLRSAWGLPSTRLADPARPLAGAMADLEALLGHAVVLDAPGLFELWRAPENYPAAVCLPVSTSTVPLGTLWVFAKDQRTFTDRELGVLEVVSGRIAAELERQTLLVEGLEGARLKRQLALAERMQQDQLPRILPPLGGWEIAAWSAAAERLGGDFYDWFPLGEEHLALAVGDAQQRGLGAALVASSLRAALRAHGRQALDPGLVLDRVNETLWLGSAGDHVAGLAYAIVEAETGNLRLATAGHPLALWVGGGRWESLAGPRNHLGGDPHLNAETIDRQFGPNELLLLSSEGIRGARDEAGRPLTEADLAAVLIENWHVPVTGLLELVRICIERHGEPRPVDDQTIVVLRRRGAGSAPGEHPQG